MIASDQLDRHLVASLGVLVEHADGSGHVERRGDVLVTAVGLGGTDFNVGWVTGVPVDPDGDLRWLLDRLEPVGSPFMVQLGEPLRAAMEPALRSAGLTHQESVPGMVLPSRADVPPPPAGLRVEKVRDAEALRAQVLATAAGFGAPNPEEVLPVFPASLLDDERVSFFAGYADGSSEPVATAACVVAEDAVGVYAVTVLDSHRRRGFGAAMTWAAVRAGAQAGVPVVALQASPMGEPVYRRMGFETVRTYHRYTPAG